VRLMSAFTVAIVAAASAALGQTAPPTLEKVSPTGAQRGTRVTVTINGSNIGGATRIIFSEPGLSAAISAIKELPIEKPEVMQGVVRTDAPIDDKAKKYELTAVVTIAATVPHGVHGFRLHTPLGVSNLLRFAVSALPEVADQEPNGADAPQKVSLPAGINGALGKSGDVDAYQFQARAGEEMVFQLVARPLGSRLDSVLRLANAQGTVIAENNDVDLSRDSTLTWRFADAGTYVVTIEDVEHGGGKTGYAYWLYAGARPYLESIPIAAPLGPATTRKIADLRRYPEVPETEPNDNLGSAQSLSIPSTVKGRTFTGNSRPDQDVFRFSAKKGQSLVFDVTAQQLGSPLDSIVEVLDASGRPVPRALIRCLAQTEVALNDPDSNRRSIRIAAWNEIAINDYLMVGDELLQVESMPTHPDDDIRLRGFRGGRTTLLDTSPRNHSVAEAVYKVEILPPGTRVEPNGMPVFQIDYVNDDGGTRFGGKDSRLHFQAPADGDYFLRLRDVRGLEGERFTYRLTVREPAPDFDVTFDPKSFNVPRGGRVSVTVTADRRDGFDGPIDVELRGLPPGLTAAPGRIPAGADTTVLLVAAAADASFEGRKAVLRSFYGNALEVPGLVSLGLVGTATIGGRGVQHEADPADPLGLVALAPAPDLVVTTTAQQIEVSAGQQVTLTVNLERHNGFTARVPITVMNLPHGVRVDDIGLNGVMITEQETTRTVHIVVEPWVQPQTQPIVVVGRVEVNSPLRNESAALPVQLVIKPATTTTASRKD
jgi:hypothetical protein